MIPIVDASSLPCTGLGEVIRLRMVEISQTCARGEERRAAPAGAERYLFGFSSAPVSSCAHKA